MIDCREHVAEFFDIGLLDAIGDNQPEQTRIAGPWVIFETRLAQAVISGFVHPDKNFVGLDRVHHGGCRALGQAGYQLTGTGIGFFRQLQSQVFFQIGNQLR